MQHFGFTSSQTFPNAFGELMSPRDLMWFGAHFEDGCGEIGTATQCGQDSAYPNGKNAVNHFYDPQNGGQGLPLCTKNAASSADWALEQYTGSCIVPWQKARPDPGLLIKYESIRNRDGGHIICALCWFDTTHAYILNDINEYVITKYKDCRRWLYRFCTSGKSLPASLVLRAIPIKYGVNHRLLPFRVTMG
jgi:hypothetical protein